MKTALSIVAACLVFGLAASAAAIDGKWSFETKTKGKRGEQKVTSVFDLKSSGDQLNGTLTRNSGRRGRSATIKDGKISGNTVSFTTVQTTKKGEQKASWTGTLDGDQLRLTRSAEGKRRGQQVVAKRQ